MTASHIKREAERVAEAIGIDLWKCFCAYKRIVGRNVIRVTTVYIDPQDISHQVHINVLPITADIGCIPVIHMTVPYIVLITAITYGNIEEAVRTECQCTGVVIQIRMIRLDEDSFGTHIGAVGVGCRNGKLRYHCRIVPGRSGSSGYRHAWTWRCGVKDIE